LKYDVWFTRLEDQLYVSIAHEDEPPMGKTKPCSSVGRVYQWMRERNKEIATVGIVPPDALGLE